MSKFNSSGYGHFCNYHYWQEMDWYEIGWYWDHHDSRIRYPRKMTRDTDYEGAVKL